MRAAERNDFEAFLEASIVFARAALHRLKAKREAHPKWKQWWSSLSGEPSVLFFRNERDFILKEGPPRIGQKIFVPSIGPGRTSAPAFNPQKASDLYYFDNPSIAATETVSMHLDVLEQLLADADRQFNDTP